MTRKIPKNYLIDATLKKLGDNYVQLYKSKFGEDIHEFLIALFHEEFFDSRTGRQKNLQEVHTRFYRDKFKRTKKNWFKSLKDGVKKAPKNQKELIGEVEYIKEGIDRYGIEQFQKTYNVQTINEFIKIRLDEIEKWVENNELGLTDYFYIKDKTKNQIKNALSIDAVMSITEIVLNEFGGDFYSIVKEVNDLENDFPLPGKTSKTKLNPSFSKVQPADEYKVGSELTILTYIINDIETKNANAIKSLDKKDWDIFRYVLSKRDIEFIERQKIFVDIGEIVKNVYESRGKKSYEQVEKRLKKLKQVLFQIIDKHGNKRIFNLLGDITIHDYANGGTRAEISIPDHIHQVYIDNHVTKVYRDRIKNFTLELSESMVFILQKERFSKQDHTHKEFSYPIEFFTRRLRFDTRNKEKILKEVDNSLKEITKNQGTVKRFYRKGDIFYITFTPVTHHEAEDLIENNPSILLSLDTVTDN